MENRVLDTVAYKTMESSGRGRVVVGAERRQRPPRNVQMGSHEVQTPPSVMWVMHGIPARQVAAKKNSLQPTLQPKNSQARKTGPPGARPIHRAPKGPEPRDNTPQTPQPRPPSQPPWRHGRSPKQSGPVNQKQKHSHSESCPAGSKQPC